MSEAWHESPYYQDSLDGVTGIQIQIAQIDLIIEASDTLTDTVQLVYDAADHAPMMTRTGSMLEITQEGHYDGHSTPVLRVPSSRILDIAIKSGKGDLRVENLQAAMAIKLGNGDLAVEGGSGDIVCNIAKGDAAIVDRTGAIVCRLGSGDLGLVRCEGSHNIDIAKGDIGIADCESNLVLRSGKGDIGIGNLRESSIEIHAASGDVGIGGGSLRRAYIDVAKGDIEVSSRLLFVEDMSAEAIESEEFEPIRQMDAEPGNDAETVRFNLGGVEFMASEAGVRISREGADLFRAGPEGVEVRRADGSEVFVASESGFRRGKESNRKSDQFAFLTRRGDVKITIPDDQAARVELIMNSGSVSSNIPLVEVGRPGPRGTTRRYVGVTNSSETDLILVRARTTRGSIQVNTGAMDWDRLRTIERRPSAESRKRSILESLAVGRLSVTEAQMLIAAIDREG